MWAAIRYRRAQALVLVLLSTLIATCAVFAPLYQRALEQALLRTNIDAASVADTALVVRAGRSAANPTFQAEELARNIPANVSRLYGQPVGQVSEQVFLTPRTGLKQSPGTLLARDRVCEHVRVTTGSCPTSAGQVLVSAKDLQAWSWKVGQRFQVTPPSTGAVRAGPQTLTLVGAYEVVPDPSYWLREQLDGKSGTLVTVGTEPVPALDDLVTVPGTFGPEWSQAQASLSVPLNRELFTLGSLAEIDALLSASTPARSGGVNGALVETQLPALIDGIRVGQEQLRVIVPLLMAQLGLLALAILLLVSQAAVEQRRPEVALARLRGRSREGAGRLVMGELALTAAMGLPLGFALALLLASLVRWFVLPEGVPFEVPWTSLLFLGIAAVACAVTIWLAARPVQRLSVSSLLRRVNRERSKGFGVVDVLAVALAAFGLVGLSTGTLDGPLALITPTLVALAAGLVASRLAVPVAGAAGRANLRRGRVGPALTAFGLERRPALRKVVTIVSVSVALTVFAANALVVGDRNWAARAQAQTGASAVLDTDSRNPAALLAATRRIDPTGREVSPVAVVRRTDAASTATMAVVSRTFDEVAFPPAEGGYRLTSLAPPQLAPVQLTGERVTGRLAWDLDAPSSAQRQLPTGVTGRPRDPSEVTPLGDPNEVRLSVTTATGQRLTRVIAELPLRGKGAKDIDALLLCPEGCRLDGLEFRKTDPLASEVSGTVTITGLGVDGTSLQVGSPDQWNPHQPPTTSPDDRFELTEGPPDTLTFELRTSGSSLSVTKGDVPAVVPGILAGPVPPGGTAQAFDAAGVNGAPITVAAVQRVPTLPVLGGRGVLVDYETLARLGGTLPDTGTLSVWLTDPERTDEVAQALASQGTGVLATHSYDGARDRLDASASAQGLRLAAFTGAMGILLAALVVIVLTVTGWRTVARDLAALHMAGVPLRTLRRALRREQVVLVVVGSAVGLVCGAVSSLLAMPLVPLFDSTATPVPALELQPSLPVILGAALLAALVLVLVGLAAATGAGRRITLRRVRESL